MDNRKSICEITPDTRLLYQRLCKLEPDESISYATLSELIGRDVQGLASHNLVSARHMAERDNAIVTDAIFGEGIKRLTDQSIVLNVGQRVLHRTRRMAKRAVRKLTKVNFDALPPELKIKQNAEVSQLSAIAAFSTMTVTNRIEHKVESSSPQPLAIQKTLEAFKG